MQSAFVDLGLERDTFLYVSDFFEENGEYRSHPDRPPRHASRGRSEARALPCRASRRRSLQPEQNRQEAKPLSKRASLRAAAPA